MALNKSKPYAISVGIAYSYIAYEHQRMVAAAILLHLKLKPRLCQEILKFVRKFINSPNLFTAVKAKVSLDC